MADHYTDARLPYEGPGVADADRINAELEELAKAMFAPSYSQKFWGTDAFPGVQDIYRQRARRLIAAGWRKGGA